jgi:hypothetical protein
MKKKTKNDLSKLPSVNYNPVNSEVPCRASATWSHAARRKWASGQFSALNELHQLAPPTHWATLKLNEPLPLGEVVKFHSVIAKAIAYQNRSKATDFDISFDLEIKTDGRHISIYAIPEINEAWCIHYHMMIRATKIDPISLLNLVISKYNRKHGRKVSMEWDAIPRVAGAISNYTVKLNGKKKGNNGQPDRDVLLFAPGSLNRYVFTAGNYFLKMGVVKLRRQNRRDGLLRLLELKADSIVADW